MPSKKTHIQIIENHEETFENKGKTYEKIDLILHKTSGNKNENSS